MAVCARVRVSRPSARCCHLPTVQTVEYDAAAAPHYNVVVSGSIGHAPIDAEAWQITKLDDGTFRRGPALDASAGATASDATDGHGGDGGSVASDASGLSKTQRKKLARREWRAERRRKKQAAAAAKVAAEREASLAAATTSAQDAPVRNHMHGVTTAAEQPHA